MALDLQRMIRHLESGDEDMVVLALRTFVKTRVDRDDGELFPRIRRLLIPMVQEGGDELRFFARQALEALGGDGEDLDGSRPGQMGREAVAALARIKALGALGGADGAEELKSMLRPDGDPWLLASVASALGRLERREDAQALLPYLRHGDGRVRANTMEALARLVPEADGLKLAMHMSADPDRRVRTNALKVLARSDQARILDEVETLARAEAISSRAAAVHVLGQLGGPRVMAVLEGLVEDEAEEVRLRVVDALASQQGLQAVRLLRKLVGDMDIDVAEKALAVYERRKAEAGIQNSVLELDLSAFQGVIHGAGARPSADGELDFDSVVGRRAGESVPSGRAQQPLPQICLVGDDPVAPMPVLPETAVVHESVPLSPPEVVPSETLIAKLPDVETREENAAAVTTVATVATEEAEAQNSRDEASETFDLATELDELDERVDRRLADIGRRIDTELRANRMQGGAHFDKLVYLVRRYETMLEKRKSAARKRGFWQKFVRSGDPTEDPGMVELEETLFEQYRRIGETAMSLAFQEGTRYAELEGDYESIEALLDEARRLKARGGRDGRQSQ